MDDGHPGTEAETHQQAWAALMHELRSPLTVVVGRLQLLRRHVNSGGGQARVEDDLEALEGAVARLVAAVERVERVRPPD
jgi:signal transduction histidine kinase